MPPWLSMTPPLKTHPLGAIDFLAFVSGMYIVVLALLAPPTPAWRLFRAAAAAPFASLFFCYVAVYAKAKCYEDQWGTILFATWWTVHAFELLVFFPAEEYCYRVTPRPRTPATSPGPEDRGSNCPTLITTDGAGWSIEPVPQPWTWAKFWWAHSLWWSMRGIGWNFAPALPPSFRKPPYSPGSSRRQFVYARLRRYALNWILTDLLRSFANLSSASAFYSGKPGAPTYADLTQLQRGIYSTCMVLRIAFGMDRTHIPFGVVMVTLGGIMGWETELCSPWGWPPLFAPLSDTWKHPGLSRMWSRVSGQASSPLRVLTRQNWHQYFRPWLWKFGWIFLGEKVLRLPRSGFDIKGPPPFLVAGTAVDRASLSVPQSDPDTSGRVSPAHPLPTTPSRQPGSVRLSNLIKSVCVFALTGWIHDYPLYFLMHHTMPRGSWSWTDAIQTTPFFVSQPFGIALESAVKSTWRGWKGKNRPEWREKEPDSVVFCERLIGFVWTWTWLGWTAGWFVDGLVRLGYYRRGDGQQVFPSLLGGLIWGVWWH